MSYNKYDDQINIIASVDTLPRRMRLDPSQYNVETQRIIRNCKNNGIPLYRMTDLECIEDIYLPNRFSRNYTHNKKVGVPMIGTSSMLNLRLPDDDRIFIDKIRNNEELFVQAGDILVSRSGTVGISVLCGKSYTGHVASDHCFRLRISNNYRGYIAAYLQTQYGLALLVKDSHGKVIKELTEENLRELPIMYFEEHIEEINSQMLNAACLYDEARELIQIIEEKLNAEFLGLIPDVTDGNVNILPYSNLIINRIDPHMYNFYSNYIFREILKGDYRLLGDVAEVWGTARFKRHYLEKDNPNGVGLYSSSDIVRANLSPSKYISKKLNSKDLKKCKIDQNTVLIPCSGTYGGIMGHGMLAGKQMAGKAITQHVLRVGKKESDMDFYYLAAFLCSNEWGYHLITATRFGKDIPEIDPDVIKSIPIPFIDKKKQEEIGALFKKIVELQERANRLENAAIGKIEKLYKNS
ncbi:MAG: restriction endonuclease subunit S [Lachnospiraceae bacterium]|nr:restriction endonuclease subunit S [Lachnospiraceae bacterium]